MSERGAFPPGGGAEAFRRYIDAFNAGDFETACSFYAPDVVLVIGSGKELRGRSGIVEFYTALRRKSRRTISVLDCFASDTLLAAELESEFLALEDMPDFTSGPMKAGDRLYINTFVLYDIQDGYFTRIRAAAFRREWKRLDSTPQ